MPHRVFVDSVQAYYWTLNYLGKPKYCHLSCDELMATRKSETVFIFGSGHSLNSISPKEWKLMEEHDTIGFNLFVHQDFVRINYHIIREIGSQSHNPRLNFQEVREYLGSIKTNARYSNTILIVQGGWTAIGGNAVVGKGLLPTTARIFRFRNKSRKEYEDPSESLSEGLVHCGGTLADCVNFAYIIGWKRIVLVGVDLYDRRYFWLRENETGASDIARGSDYTNKHNMADKTITVMAKWKEYMGNRGVDLYVYNPKSLLAHVLPVFNSIPQRVTN